MTTYVAERTKTVDVPAAQVDKGDSGRDEPAVTRQHPRQDEWRWVTDPAEVDLPTPPAKPSPSSALIMALAWANAH